MPLREALDQAILCFDAVLMIGTANTIVFGEVEKGGRGKYLLSAADPAPETRVKKPSVGGKEQLCRFVKGPFPI